jgi:hypothetical protein
MTLGLQKWKLEATNSLNWLKVHVSHVVFGPQFNVSQGTVD